MRADRLALKAEMFFSGGSATFLFLDRTLYLGRIVVGVVQITGSVLTLLFASIGVCAQSANAKSLATHAWRHLQHGTGNIARGIYSGTLAPEIVFTFLAICFTQISPVPIPDPKKFSENIEDLYRFDNGQQDKLMPYPSQYKHTGKMAFHPYAREGKRKDSYEAFKMLDGISYVNAKDLGLIDDKLVIDKAAFKALQVEIAQKKIESIKGRLVRKP